MTGPPSIFAEHQTVSGNPWFDACHCELSPEDQELSTTFRWLARSTIHELLQSTKHSTPMERTQRVSERRMSLCSVSLVRGETVLVILLIPQRGSPLLLFQETLNNCFPSSSPFFSLCLFRFLHKASMTRRIPRVHITCLVLFLVFFS